MTESPFSERERAQVRWMIGGGDAEAAPVLKVIEDVATQGAVSLTYAAHMVLPCVDQSNDIDLGALVHAMDNRRKTIVVAARYRHAINYVHAVGLRRGEFILATREDELRGVRQTQSVIVVVDTGESFSPGVVDQLMYLEGFGCRVVWHDLDRVMGVDRNE